MVNVSSSLSSDVGTRSTVYSLSIDTSGIDKLPDEVRKVIRIAVGKGVNDLQATVVQEIRAKNLIKTGNLMNSISGFQSLDGLMGTVLVGAFYGIYLEFGTIHMSARPFFGPAVDRVAPIWIRVVETYLRLALGGS